MNPSRSPDVSLYEVATSSEPPPQPLQFSPTTFKSLVSILIDLLIEQQLPATIWLKLPRGDVWFSEIERFCQAAKAPYSLFNLLTYQDSSLVNGEKLASASPTPNNDGPIDQPNFEMGEHPPQWDWLNFPEGNADEIALLQEQQEQQDTAIPNLTVGSNIHALPLATDSQLKREYFLLVAAPGFYGLVLAHRPRSMRSRTEAAILEATPRLGQAAEENLEQKHPLLGLCSFNQSLIERVLEGINRAICFGQPATQSSQDLEKLIISWEDLVAEGKVTTASPLQFETLLTKQIQRQEEIWRSGAIYRRQAESTANLRQENEQLLNSLQLKDEFIKIMGQELRTPLTSMKTALSLLNSPHLKPAQRQRYMDMLSHECDRQSALITSVLDLVQIESTVEQAPMEPLRLTDIVPGVVSTYQPLAQEKGLMLGYTIPEDLPPVSCITPWLRQIVINLLSNSIKFTPTGGQVWVRAKQQGGSIQIEFRDTGIGIAQADIPKIFERFYRVRGTGEDAGGAGLGLSIVQQLLLRCGGSIAVKSKVGEGSVFTVLLPIYEREESLSNKNADK